MEVKPGYKQTEVGVIPNDWEVNTIGEMGDVCAGKALAARGAGRQRPYLRTKNVFDGRIDLNDVLSMPMTEAEFSRYRLQHGDVLLNEGQSLELVGRCAMYKDEYREPCAIQNQLIRFRARDGVSADFAAHLFRHCQQSGVFTRIALQTTSVAHLGVSRFDRLLQAWPTKAEQEAIAGALSDVDALIGALDQLIAKKRDLKQAAMQQLLTGQKRLPGFHGEWEVKRLGDCLLSRPDYGINAPAVPFSDKLPSYIRITDISEHGRFCPDPRVSVKAANTDQYFLHDGEVVFARTGASVGKSYLYESHGGQLVFAGFLIRVRPTPDLLVPAFLAAYATTKPYWNWVRLMSMRSGQPGINGNEYAQLPLSLPPLPEQTAIAEVLSDMDAELAALEQRRDKTRALKQGMMQELLTGRTRLVDKRRGDE
jgi:type I restriction enzyme S subunit